MFLAISVISCTRWWINMAHIGQSIPKILTMISDFIFYSNNYFQYETSDLGTDSGSSSSESSENYFDPSEKGIRPDYSEDYNPNQVLSRSFFPSITTAYTISYRRYDWSFVKVGFQKIDDIKIEFQAVSWLPSELFSMNVDGLYTFARPPTNNNYYRGTALNLPF